MTKLRSSVDFCCAGIVSSLRCVEAYFELSAVDCQGSRCCCCSNVADVTMVFVLPEMLQRPLELHPLALSLFSMLIVILGQVFWSCKKKLDG